MCIFRSILKEMLITFSFQNYTVYHVVSNLHFSFDTPYMLFNHLLVVLISHVMQPSNNCTNMFPGHQKETQIILPLIHTPYHLNSDTTYKQIKKTCINV